MGKHASPLLVAESGPGVEFAVATGAKTLTGIAGVTGLFVVVVGAVAVVVGAAGVEGVDVEVWLEAAGEPPVAIELGEAALPADLLAPQPLSTNTKHAI